MPKKDKKEYEEKKQINIFLNDDLISKLEKRAKKNLMSLPEQIEDILRRSTINQGKTSSVYDQKLDDKLV